jgi:hypothetical protein
MNWNFYTNVIWQSWKASLPLIIPLITTIAGYAVGFRLGRRDNRISRKEVCQHDFLLKIDRLILDICGGHPLILWGKHQREIENGYLQFRLHLGNGPQRRFDKAWADCKKIHPNDLTPDASKSAPEGQLPGLKEARDKIVDPLREFREITEAT